MGGADQSDQGLRNTPWGLWSAAGKKNKDLHVTQGSISAMIDDIKRQKIERQMKEVGHSEFQRKSWMQIDMPSSAWATACPKEHSALNARHFLVVAQTYFGVPQQCLEGVVGHAILANLGKREGSYEKHYANPTERTWSKPLSREGGGRTTKTA